MAPNKKKKKAVASNPARGFATTSLPSKAKIAEPEPDPEPVAAVAEPDKEEQQPQWQPPTAEEEAELALKAIVDTHGIKVRREAQRIIAKSETEKRTLRGSGMCYPLKLDKIFGIDSGRFGGGGGGGGGTMAGIEETLGEKVLQMAKKEYTAALEKSSRVGTTDDGILVQAWTLHKVLLGLGFAKLRVEEGVQIILNRAGRADKDVETLLDEVLEWMALFCSPDEMPKYLEIPSSINPNKKDSAAPANSGKDSKFPANSSANSGKDSTSTPAKEAPAASKRRRPSRPPNKNSSQKPPKPSLTPASLVSDISNLELEPKDISDQGESSSEDESDYESLSESELTPEIFVPLYLQIQTRLYKIHPTVASIITGGKKAKGGGKKPVKNPPKPPPANLSDTKKQKVKRLQQKLIQLERDPLFDAYTADTAWKDARAKLEEEDHMKEQAKNPPKPIVQVSLQPSKVSAVNDEEDMGLMGGLFEGQATEEATSSGVNIPIRDFEESYNTTDSPTAKKAGKGKAGVGAAAMRKLMNEICRSRDPNPNIRYDIVTGTAISSRIKMTISWFAAPDIETTVIPPSGEDPPDIIIRRPKWNATQFEMRGIAAATKEQAEGYTITYALFKLYGKKEEKLYLRLPTIWRNLWLELVEIDKTKSEIEERKVLEQLKKLLDVEHVMPESKGTVTKAQNSDAENPEVDVVEDSLSKPKPSYQRYLEGDVLREDWIRRRETPAFLQMEEGRMSLPMWGFRHEIIQAVENNPVVVLCGETGCGKSTQLPAFLMEHEIMNDRVPKIYCTQPRRISALSLARRVAEEMGEGKGRVGGLVGYSIRLENMVTDATRLIYATTGIVMRMLEGSSSLENVTHLVLDEVHERTIESDFLMVVLKRLLLRRKDLKVILMSATVNAEAFADYLGGAPVLRVPGRTFPVQEYFLEDAIETTKYVPEEKKINKRNHTWEDDDAEIEDTGNGYPTGNLEGYSSETRAALNRLDQYQIPYELIVGLLEKIATSPEYADYSRAILVFLPGLAEIRRLNDMILGHPYFGSFGRYGSNRNGPGGWLVHMLHSTIASEDQEQAFLIPPNGMRKIVLATNIAETGVTIPDVTAVIDTGKHKEMRFDEKRQLSRLVQTFISKANAKQRRGRAGRVQAGICWHLFTKEQFQTTLADQQTPEILRLSLQDLVLRVKICGLGNIEEVLTSALDSPTPKNIRRAVDSLVEVKALTAAEELTPLGRQLAKLPLDVYLGKLVLLGSIFCCLDATVAMAALLSSKSPFIAPIGYKKEAESCRMSFKRGDSDLLTGWNAYSAWRKVCMDKGSGMNEADFCRRNYLSSRALSGIEDLKAQLFASLVDAGFLNLTPAERQTLNRARYSSYRRTTFFIPPDATNLSSPNNTIVCAAIAGAFYPKLLVREGKGWRTIVGSGKIVHIHRSSVNVAPGPTHKQDIEWLAYYSLMQGYTGFDAQETSKVEAIIIALVCGEAEWRPFPGVLNVDGNRVRFSLADWKGMIALKMLRSHLKDIVNRTWKTPEKNMTENQQWWMQCFWEVFAGLKTEQNKLN